MKKEQLAKYIDHTLLGAYSTKEQIQKLCMEAKEYTFASVCVNPANIEYCREILDGCEVKICCVVGFPLGAQTTETKAFETKDAIEKGAEEIDMVINIGALKDKDYDKVLNDIKAVVTAAAGKTVKVIIETCYLTDEEKIKASELTKEAKADFVKTSTGFGTAGATLQDVILMKKAVGDECMVKAAGGIRNYEDAIKMIEAGADRLGTSAGIAIIDGCK